MGDTMSNPFLVYGAPSPARTRRPRTEKQDKELADRDRQARAWRKWRRERINELLAGPHGAAAQELMQFLEQLESAPALIEFVKRGPWRNADDDTRFLVLGLIDIAITEVREKRGLPPFDDALPGEPPNAFVIIRDMLR
jgi:hypothetical protein